MTWTSVVSYHTDPESCGVARFSAQLAQRLGVPHAGTVEQDRWGANPLLSVKFSEWDADIVPRRFDQLWHDEPPYTMLTAGRVWRLYNIGVPALVEPVEMAPQALFTFGMASKLEVELFAKIREPFFDRQLWISTAEHEGAGPSRVPALMALWGDGARDLGHLSDAALQLVWPRVLAFVAFFAHGLRANNSSVHAALDAGVTVITNHGDQTPDDLREVTLDYRDLYRRQWPLGIASPYTWDRLLKELGCG